LIKYLGSKRTLIPTLTTLAAASGASSALDLFTGTTRVAKAFKSLGVHVIAADIASYSEIFAKTWIELDAERIEEQRLTEALAELSSLPGEPGYFTQTYCIDARFFQPENGARVDAMRAKIESDYKGTELYNPLLTALILAADRVDSTTGLQMAFLKTWARRSFNKLEMRDPGLLAGGGLAIRGDALEIAKTLPEVELAYLDPPYNQHRYFSNYHIWESLVRWDKPETYGIANKRLDARSIENKSPFNSKKTMPAAVEKLIQDVNAQTVVLSYNNESWLSKDDLIAMCETRGHVEVVDVDFKRYVGSQIGVYNKKGQKVGTPGARRNVEYIVIAGDKATVKKMVDSVEG
jgi:adenine-specific DNA-methyltransferase